VQTLNRNFFEALALPGTSALLARGPAGMRAHEAELHANVRRLRQLRDHFRHRHAASLGASGVTSAESSSLPSFSLYQSRALLTTLCARADAIMMAHVHRSGPCRRVLA
jgi:hypothetical protein